MNKIRVYIKDSGLKGLNLHHFNTHGRIFEVAIIDYEAEEVSVRTPSMLEFKFKDVEFLPDLQ